MKSAVLSIVFALSAPLALLAQGPQSPPIPVIVVSGNADVRVSPDEAVVRIGIVRQANNARTVQQQANAAAQEILAAIRQTGVLESDIQTSRLTLTPVYAPRRPDSAEAPRIVAYNAQNVVSVRVRDLALIGQVIDAGLGGGANQLEGVQFGLRNELPSREQALKEAVTEARKKAETIAEALNVRIAGVLELSENGVSVMPKSYDQFALRTMAAAEVATPVSPGEIEVHAGVTVRFRIEEKTSTR